MSHFQRKFFIKITYIAPTIFWLPGAKIISWQDCLRVFLEREAGLNCMEGLMAPTWEPWVVLNELPRRLKDWFFARPSTNFATAIDDGSVSSLACPAVQDSSDLLTVQDSSDLLRRRMAALHLDPNDVDRPTAQLVGIKTGLCAHCAARGECMKDLDDEFADLGWGDWRNYCPNATTLSILSTLGNCVEEQQQQDEREKTNAGSAWQTAKQPDDTLSQA